MANRPYQFPSDRNDLLSLHINVKVAVTIIGSIVVGAVATSWQLWDLRQSIKDGTGDRWRKSEMREYAHRMKDINGGSVKVPDVDQVAKDLN